MSSKHMKIDSLFEGDKYRGYFKRKDGLLDFHRDDSQNDLFDESPEDLPILPPQIDMAQQQIIFELTK